MFRLLKVYRTFVGECYYSFLGNMSTKLLNNRYRVIKVLGAGGFGETFLAEDTYMPSSRLCVIKKLKPITGAPQTYKQVKQRFEREAAILELLGEGSDQIPQLYAYFSEQGLFYLVQEWIRGQTLTEILEREGVFSETQVRSILLSLLCVLDYVHSKGIIHRDIKPDNIILSAADGKPVLIDFGAVKETIRTVNSSPGRFSESLVIGTPGYMSSEQAIGRPVYASDIYGLGLTAIFLLSGKTPQELQNDRQSGEIFWQKYAPEISPQLTQIIARAIKVQASDRFTTARKMLYALESEAVSSPTTIAVNPETLNQNSSTVVLNGGRTNHPIGVVSSHPKTGIAGISSPGSVPKSVPGNWQKIPAIVGSLLIGSLIGGTAIFAFNRQLQPENKLVDSPETPKNVRLAEDRSQLKSSQETQSPSSPTTPRTENKSVNSKSVNSKSLNSKSVNPKSLNSKSVNSKSLNSKSVNSKSLNSKSVNSKSRSITTPSVTPEFPSQSPSINPRSPSITTRPQSVTPKSPSIEKPSIENPPVKKPSIENPPVEKPSIENPPVKNPSVKNPSIEKPPVKNPPIESTSITTRNPSVVVPTTPQKPGKNVQPPVVVHTRNVRKVPVLFQRARNQNSQTANNHSRVPNSPGIKSKERSTRRYRQKAIQKRKQRLRRKAIRKIEARKRRQRRRISQPKYKIRSRSISKPRQISQATYTIDSKYISKPRYERKPRLRRQPRTRRQPRVRRRSRF